MVRHLWTRRHCLDSRRDHARRAAPALSARGCGPPSSCGPAPGFRISGILLDCAADGSGRAWRSRSRHPAAHDQHLRRADRRRAALAAVLALRRGGRRAGCGVCHTRRRHVSVVRRRLASARGAVGQPRLCRLRQARAQNAWVGGDMLGACHHRAGEFRRSPCELPPGLPAGGTAADRWHSSISAWVRCSSDSLPGTSGWRWGE